MEKLGRLEHIRKCKGLSRKDLAKLSGVGEQTIVALETGINNVNNAKLSTLVNLAKALKVKVIDLLDKELHRYIA